LCWHVSYAASSTGLEERLVRAVADGLPMREAARRFDVAVTTVKRAVVQERDTSSLERNPILGCPRRIGPEQASTVAHQVQVSVIPSWLGTMQIRRVQFPEAGTLVLSPRYRAASPAC
jgi:transposase